MKHVLIPEISRLFLQGYGLENTRNFQEVYQHLFKEGTVLDRSNFFNALVEYGVQIETIFLSNDVSAQEFEAVCTGSHYPFLVLAADAGGEALPVMILPLKHSGKKAIILGKEGKTEKDFTNPKELGLKLLSSAAGTDGSSVMVITCFPNQDPGASNGSEDAMPDAASRFVRLGKFFNLLVSEKREILYLLLYAVFVGVISLSLPLGVQSLIGFISSGRVVTSAVVLISFIVLGVLISGVMTIMQLHLVEYIHQRLFAKTAFSFAFRVPRIRVESVLKYYPPELMNRFFDTLTLMKGMSVILIDFSSAILQTIFGIILLSFYHPLFIVVGAVLVSVLLLILRFTGPKGIKTALKESAFKYMTANWLEEIARSLSTFKLAGNTNFALEKTDFYVSNYIQAREEHFKVLKVQYYSFVVFKTVITALLLIVGAFLITDRQINLGQFVAAEIVIILIMNAIEKIILKLDNVYDVLVSVEKITDVTTLPVEVYKGIDLQVKEREGIAVRFRDVCYQFPDRNDLVLQNVSLEVEKGERICIAGFNGSGKTTLANLMIGLYENYTGIISFNGISLRDLNKASLMNHLGDYVSQEGLFDGTIFENIVIGRTSCKIEDVHWALEAAGLSDYINGLPEGLNTRLIGGTVRISESMARKIIIARNIVERPGLLVLDDFLLGVERKEKKRILDVILGSDFHWTVVLISNDPIIMDAVDRVVIMRKGSIVESGVFRKLAASNSDLQELIRDYNIS